MKTIVKLFTLLTVALAMTSCSKEDVQAVAEDVTVSNETGYTITYIAGERATSVRIANDEEKEALLDRFCDLAQEGLAVTFRNESPASSAGKASKEPTTISTTDREEMVRWMARMEDAGMTVTVTYDSETGRWHGTAYCTTAPAQQAAGRRLSRITYQKEAGGVYSAIYNYTWNGDLLTRVDIEEGDLYSSRRTRTTVVLNYDNGLCNEIRYYDSTGTLLRYHSYTYFDGRLVQEWLSASNQSYTFQYDSVGNIVTWVAVPDHNTIIPNGERCEWENGDMVRTYMQDRLYATYEYDNSPHPYGITFGTKTLMPGTNYMSGQEIHWSRHNITHFRAANGKSSGTDLRINYTYDERGYPVTAETNWFGAYNITWTYEYLD